MKAKRCLLLTAVFVMGFIAGIATHRWFTTGDIHDASRKGSLRKVKCILTQNPELVNATEGKSPYWTPLHFAAWYGHKDVVEFLVTQGAHENARDKMGGTPLYAAVGGGHKDIVRLLLTREADVNAKTSDWTALHLAVIERKLEMVKILLANGADVNVKDDRGKTLLYYAVDSEIAGLLRKPSAVEKE